MLFENGNGLGKVDKLDFKSCHVETVIFEIES